MGPDTPIRTPLIRAPLLDGRLLWLKDEGAQPSGSFKLRGASHFLSVNRISSGVVTTASTGNHAIGLSLAARANGLHAVIMVPRSTPARKLASISAAGGEIRLIDGDYQDALAEAERFAADGTAYLVPSYDHADIIVGNRNVFLEILEDLEPDNISMFVPIGGGGLFSGAVQACEGRGIPIIGVELSPYERVTRIAWNKQGDLPHMDKAPEPSTEGVAIRTLGVIPTRIMREASTARFTSVEVAELRAACRWLWHAHGVRAELGGCTALAAALRETPPGGISACVISGSNIDADLHADIVAQDADDHASEVQ
ncbi:threonine ammonia-lyase [Paracoccus zeaxanthinifaciens]|uniref:threonine ammonia-lyase n=1 Tax=Paracoccus zeaxanthinifaciens TaxID=187400 RepID=UPI0003B59A62|nr:pyridoxal-phosphate dependent enzyme [Paracoccus zeaxanthinifaciens]